MTPPAPKAGAALGPAGTAAGCAITFQVRVETSFGSSVVLVGSSEVLGKWELQSGLTLTTTPDTYPLWTTGPITCPIPTKDEPVQYKYVRVWQDGRVEWEAEGGNRAVVESISESGFVVDDGHFGYIQAGCFAFPNGQPPVPPGTCAPRSTGPVSLRAVVLGDAAAAGAGARSWEGWAARLGAALSQTYGYGYANASGRGTGLDAALEVLRAHVREQKPTVVVLAFGLELQALVQGPDHEASEAIARFCEKLDGLAQAALDSGTFPVLGGIYPHANCSPEQEWRLRQAEEAIDGLGLPVLRWLSAVSANGRTWDDGTSWTPAEPNTEGHSRMAAAIDLAIFEPSGVLASLAAKSKAILAMEPRVCFSDGNGFVVSYCDARGELSVKNATSNEYQLSAGWAAMCDSLRATKRQAPWSLRPGLYIACASEGPDEGPASITLGVSGKMETEAKVPAGWCATLRPVAKFLESEFEGNMLFNDGNLAVVHERTGSLVLVNQARCEYNVHPMWNDVRLATRVVPEGIYEDDSDCPFRTAVVSIHGLQSRVKVPAKTAIRLRFKGPLSSVPRIAVLPLGDRCSIRMLLHKVEYDGPCYPFDLTRTTALSDVADMIGSGFTEMWNQGCLVWSEENGRVYHTRWGGLSFAHEVEPGEDPQQNFNPIAERMRKRYSGRSARFDYACKHADRVMFMRTGCASRDEVCDLLSRVQQRYPWLKASLLLISDQPSEEFADLAHVSHVREHFDPDRMYEDLGYWMDCAHRFRGILHQHGITERTLYWCPNNLAEADQEIQGGSLAKAGAQPGAAPPRAMGDVRTLSHSRLYEPQPPHAGPAPRPPPPGSRASAPVKAS